MNNKAQFIGFIFSMLISCVASAQVPVRTHSDYSAAFAEDKIAKLPLLFRKNMGQWDEKILFAGSSRAANVYFMKNELSFGFIRPVKNREEEEEENENETVAEAKEISERAHGPEQKPQNEMLVWNVQFEGANTGCRVTAAGEEKSTANYFIGNDPKKYSTQVPDNRMLTYSNIYNGIDLKYYGSGNRLKYDFVVQPHANAEDIKMTYEGIRKIRISREGELVLSTAWGKMKEDKPFTYQYVNGRRSEIKSMYVLLNDSTVGFKMLEEYDHSRELIIDPIILDWTTFVGGTGNTNNGSISKVALDAAGNVYAVGSYTATFPTTAGSYNTVFGGQYDVFVFKLNPTGTALVYSTYIGGNQWDSGTNIYLNAANEVYITGQTSSFNWPVLNAYDPTFNGGGDVFVTKLNAAGSALLFSTFLGGSGSDMGQDITLDPSNNVYIIGNTSSNNYPTTAGALQTTLKGYSDMVVSKLSPTGNALLRSTLLGSSKNETGVGLGVNAAGEVTAGGNTDSLDFPTTAGAYDQTYNDGPNIYNLHGDMAIFKLNATMTGLIYSTFLGGNIDDVMQGMYVTANDEAFVCGVILFSNNYPITAGVVGPTTGPGTFDSFVTRLNSTGSALVYSTYLGNADPSSDEARDIWVNACDEAYITGDGGSVNTFPVTTASCVPCKGGEDVYVCKLNPTATSYIWSTFVGSKDWDVCGAIAVYVGAVKEEVAIGFGSNSFVYPTTAGVFQPIKLTTDSIYTVPGVTKFSDTITAGGVANAGPDVTICAGASITLNGSGAGTSYVWSPGGQTTTSIAISPTATATYTFSVIGSCGTAKDSVTVTVASSITAAIAGNISICAGQSTTLTASGGNEYTWSTGSSVATIIVTPSSNTTYTVIVKSGSCPEDTAMVKVFATPTPTAVVTGNAFVCSGQSSTLTASGGATYSWNTGSTATALVISPTANTTYTVIVDNGSGCKATATQSVTVLPGFSVTASSTPAGCTVNNGTTLATPTGGTGPFTYNWNNGQSTQTASGLAAGNYSVIITDAGGCTKTQTVSVTSNSTLALAVSSTQSGCSVSDGTATANASNGTPGYTYSWSDGQTTSAAVALGSGSYTVTVTDAAGCTKTQTVNVTQAPGPSATASATATTVSLGGSTTLTATGGGTYLWSPNTDLSCSTCSNPTASPSQTTIYCVVVTDANNCKDSTCITINVDIPCGTIYLPNAFSPNSDLENDLECVMGSCIDTMHLVIYNRWGQIIFESRDQTICWDGTFKGDALDPAVFSYYLEATLTSGTKINKRGNVTLVR